jgi:hypothetical protein
VSEEFSALAVSIDQPPKALETAAEILFRQVHPNLFDGGEPASSAFVPNASDDGHLSVDRSSLTTAQESYELYVGSGRLSGGVYGITVGEFGAHGLNCRPDPLKAEDGRKPNPAHALVDYNGLGTNQRKNVGKRLKATAASRGLLHKV